MHWLDLVIVGVIAWSTFAALSNGLIREVVTVGAVIAGGLLAGRLYGDLSSNIEFLIDDQITRDLASFVAIFGGVVILGQIGATLVRGAAAVLMLGPVDRLGGALFGFAKGVVFVEVLIIAFAAFPAAAGLDVALHDSTLAPVLLEGVPFALRLLPEEFAAPVAAIT